MDNAELIVASLTGANKREAAKAQHDPVNHPSHYTAGNIECVDFIEDQELEWHEGNAMKYIVRAKRKDNRIEDLKKAIWYLNRKVQLLEKERNYQS